MSFVRPNHPPLAAKADGPLASWLDGVLISSGVVANMQLDRREDIGEGPGAGGIIQYLSEGGYLNATVQRPPRQLDDRIFTDGGAYRVLVLGSGTEAVVREVDPRPSGFAQVILRRSDGSTAQITAGGMAGDRPAVRPLSREQVYELAESLDDALAHHPPTWPRRK